MSTSSLTSTTPSKPSNNGNKENDIITLTEKIKMKQDQYEVLKIICNTYQASFSQYIQEAIIDAMMFDIEEGNFCDAMLEKIRGEGNKKDNSSLSSSPASPFAPELTKSDLDLLKKLQMHIS